ncbi:MAG: glutaredoxin family protein [Microbacteriaceae bacterium]|nr:glutaredoxin family protein [Microbacteriaceae bacterium]MDR9443968.1 glutaredoxin family protein [Microbacteriaceae bacterium]
MSKKLVLISKPGCHLCDDAREIILEVLKDFPDASFEENNMLDDQKLIDAYSEEIPVVLIDGKQHSFWRVDPERLKKALR